MKKVTDPTGSGSSSLVQAVDRRVQDSWSEFGLGEGTMATCASPFNSYTTVQVSSKGAYRAPTGPYFVLAV